MRIMKYLTKILVFLGIIGMASCSQKSKWDAPDTPCQNPPVSANATIADIIALSPGGQITQIDQDLNIEGYVISSDEAGNFYTTMVIQDAPQNPTAGITVVLDKRNLYVDYPVGKKVIIKTKGLFIGKDNGVYKLGLTYDNGHATHIGRMPASEVDKRIFATCDDPVTIVPTEVSVTDIRNNGDQYVNTLVKVKDVQFKQSDLCSTYALEGLSGVNKYLEDCNGVSLVMRNSGYASFAKQRVPTGKGDVVAVLGKYRNTFQLYIRDTNDVQLVNPRCDGSQPTCDASSLTPNATIADLKSALGNNTLMQITNDWVLDATVTASDKSGNLYKSVYIQDQTGGIRLGINLRDLYLRGYHRGAKIRIKAKDLYIGKTSGGELELGDLYNGHIGRIGDDIDQDHIFFLNEDEQVEPEVITPGAVTYDQVGKLVKIEDAVFAPEDVLETFAFSDSQSSHPSPRAANRTLTVCAGSGQITVRTSGYANFADAHVRYGRGTLTGILSCYDANHNGSIDPDEYQIILRDIYDVDMNAPRCDQPKLLETFGLTTKNEPIDLNGWYNYAEAGTRQWQGGFYLGSINHYAQMSAYRSNEAQNIAWLISPPIAISNGTTLHFQTAKAYWTHDALDVFISTDFNGYDVRSATWIPLQARIATDTDPNHAWIDSGNIDLSAYAGHIVRIAFRYKGSDTYHQTSTYRIDNVIIK